MFRTVLVHLQEQPFIGCTSHLVYADISGCCVVIGRAGVVTRLTNQDLLHEKIKSRLNSRNTPCSFVKNLLSFRFLSKGRRLLYTELYVLYCGRVPAANAPGCTAA